MPIKSFLWEFNNIAWNNYHCNANVIQIITITAEILDQLFDILLFEINFVIGWFDVFFIHDYTGIIVSVLDEGCLIVLNVVSSNLNNFNVMILLCSFAWLNELWISTLRQTRDLIDRVHWKEEKDTIGWTVLSYIYFVFLKYD